MKKYQTIVIDPPWEVTKGPSFGGYKVIDGKQVFNSLREPSQTLSYPTMTIQEISNLKIPFDKNAHLYLWVINSYIPDAYKIINKWGFTPSTLITWVKNPNSGLGGCYKSASEWILFCRKGILKSKKTINKNWFNWKRPYFNGYPKHSAKPREFYEMVETVSPSPYLELFAREKRDGWDVWGNEVESDINLLESSYGI